jgi:protein TonB
MDKDSRDKRFIRKPIYPGGKAAYNAFITSNLKYPEAALKKRIEGKVRLRYGINYKGDVIEVKVQSSLGHGCDEEAIRIIKLLKFEVPKGPRKLKVLFHKTITINFKLPKQKIVTKKIVMKKPKITSASSITYTVIKPKTPEKKQETYNYTIKYGK